jgi:hypothetical protein
MDDETGRDFQLATRSLRDDHQILKPMRQLALGTTKASELLPGLPKEAKFLSFLCGVNGFKPESDHQVMRLVPPYASLCEKRIMENEILRTYKDEFCRPGELNVSRGFVRRMVLFEESRHNFDEQQEQFINEAIVK